MNKIQLSNLKHAYRTQKSTSKRRGIEFLLTFDEWLDIWQESGKLKFRGIGKGCYCMARYGDIGPYSILNVKIVPFEVNASEIWATPQAAIIKKKMSASRLGKPARNKGIAHTDETKNKMSEIRRGKKLPPFSDEHKRKLSVAARGRKFTPEECEARRQRRLGTYHSEETKRKMSLARQRYWDKKRADV